MIKKINNFFWIFLLGALIVFNSIDVSSARENPTMRGNKLPKVTAAMTSQSMANIGNWGYWFWAEGITAHDPYTDGSGGFYPRGTAGAIYMDGLVWGGIVVGDPDASKTALRVGGNTYSSGTQPGWWGSDPNDEKARIYRIRDDVFSLTSAMVVQDAAELNNVPTLQVTDQMTSDIINQYREDWAKWPVDLGAPYYDVNENGVYDPVLDDSNPPMPIKPVYDGSGNLTAGGDYPGLAQADQVVFFVINDNNLGKTTGLYGSVPIGIECQTTVWAYNQPENSLGQIVFKKYKVINKSAFVIDSMYFSQWSDPDLGDYGNDLTGCDTTLSLMFAYNGPPADDQYAAFKLAPPAVGYDFFQGPMVPGSPTDTAVFDLKKVPGYKNLPMTSYGYFGSGTDWTDPDLEEYNGTLQWYNLLRGYAPTDDIQNPTWFVASTGPNAGNPTKFPLSGDPISADGDVDGIEYQAGDRRMLQCTGPFTMNPNDEQEVVVAVLGGLGANNLTSVSDLKSTDNVAQLAYNSLFTVVPKPPVPPKVQASILEDKIVLNWGWDAATVKATEETKIINYEFEGYNVYQLASATSRISDKTTFKIATYDIVNDIRIIYSTKFVPEYSTVVEVPVQYGEDAGVKRTITIEKDYITGRPLYRGTPYYFAVTAYNFDGNLVRDRALESSPTIYSVIPQNPNPGVRLGTEVADEIEVTHSAGVSDGQVVVSVIDPYQVTGHDYRVNFVEDTDTNSATYGEVFYNITDVTDGELVLEKGKQVTNPEEKTQLQLDGLEIVVSGPADIGINLAIDGPYGYYPGHMGYGVTGGARWVSWPTNWGLETMGGSLGNGYSFFGSDVTSKDYVNVAIRFAGCSDFSDTTSEGLMAASKVEYPDRWQKAVVYHRPTYAVQPTLGDVPFTVWDTENNRQLKVAFVEEPRSSGGVPLGNANLIWDMGWDGSDFPAYGGREYMFIINDTYDETYTEYLNGNLDGTYNGVLYASGWGTRGYPYLYDDFEIQIFASHLNFPEDQFTFTAPAAAVENNDLAKVDVEKINVFPNPYYAYNPLESGRFDRFVRFNHLPRKATFRIFSLGGAQVRKLEKDTNSQFFDWNLQNESGLPVASGVYIVHIEMPELGKEKVLKLFVVQSQQVLEYY
ncbi:MAG: hypothetical protein JXB44_04815 [Calditrichaceae bacterium]|nr:hypothetical protein [Calditrichaceae bacterium]RQV96123.1 MAG: hypothetical protein EH224_05300 [Calditrichota bacterium]